MAGVGILPLAIAVFLVGGGLLLAAWIASRVAAKRRPPTIDLPRPAVETELGTLDDAVLVAQAGGRLVAINERAREWFGLDGSEPDLMHLARQARPADSFLELFAVEGQATLEIETTGPGVASRRVEATSHQVTVPDEGTRFVVVLREAEWRTQLSLEDERAVGAAQAVAEIAQAISSSLDLENTLESILSAAARLVPSDAGAIALWEPENDWLRPRRWHGDRDYILVLETQTGVSRPGEGYSGWLAQHRRPLLIPDTAQRRDIRPKVGPDVLTLSAFLGVPLAAGDNFLGTLELFSLSSNAFAERHQRLLEAIAGQAAVAIQNAQRHEAQQQRVEELSGLAEVAQAAGALADPRELYGRLTERIARLMRAQMCGILLYDETAQALVAQPTFFGVPEAWVGLYRIPISPDGPIAQVWRQADYWLSNDVPRDRPIAETGPADLLSSLGIQQSLVVPIILGGERLGVVQVSNRPQGRFDEADARLLSLLAGQAAALIDNARLVRETRTRAERAEGLRRLSVIVGSAQPLDEILRQAVEETARLLGADMAALLLIDEARGELSPHAPSAYGVPPEFISRTNIPMSDPLFRLSVARTQQPLVIDQGIADERIHPNYRPLLLSLELNSGLDVPLIVQERGIGELFVGARRPNAYGPAEIELLITAAAQIATAVERARLAEATDENLRRRVDQLTAVARISRRLNQTLDLERLLTSVRDESIGATGAHYVTIALVNADTPLEGASRSEAQPIVRRVGNVAFSQRPEALPHAKRETDLSPAEADVIRTGHMWLAPELTPGPDRLAADSRSAVIVPVVFQGLVVGLIHLQSRFTQAFDPTAVEFLQALADQISIAIGNAQRYQEQLARGELLRRRAEQLSQLYQVSRAVRPDRPIADNLESVALGVQEAAGFDVVIMSLLNPASGEVETVAAAGLPLAAFDKMKKVTQPWELIKPMLKEEHRLSQSYFIPRLRRAQTGPLGSLFRTSAPRSPAPTAWQRDDLLLVPLRGSAGEVLGLMRLDDPRSGEAPDRAIVETLEIFANQAALAIESARLYQTSEARALELAQRLNDLSQSYKELDEVSQSLRQKDEQLTRTVAELDHRARRLLSLTHVSEALSTTREPEVLVRFAAEAIAGEMQVEACLIALRDRAEGEHRIAASAGYAVPPGSDLGPLIGPASPVVEVIEKHQPLLARDVETSQWREDPLIVALGVRAFACVPILLEGRSAGALFVASRQHTSLGEQELDLFSILASQLGISLENAGLYAETQRRLAEQTLLYETGADLSRLRDPKSTLNVIAERVGRALNADLCLISDFNETAQTIAALAVYSGPAGDGASDGQTLLGLPFRLRDYPATARILESTESHAPVIIHAADAQADRREVELLNELGFATRLALALISTDQVVGLLEVYYTGQRTFAPEEIRLVQALANQAGVAFESARLAEAVRERASQLEALARVSHVISSTLRADELISVALDRLAEVIAYDSAAMWLKTEAGMEIAALKPIAAQRGDGRAPVLEPGVYAALARDERAIVVPDVTTDARFDQRVMRAERSWLGVPLRSKGEMIGVLTLSKVEAGFFTNLHGELASAFADQMAVSLDNARLYDQARQFNEQLERTVAERTQALSAERDRVQALLRITSELSASLDLDRVLQRALTLVSEIVGASKGSIFLIDPQSDQLIYRAALGRSKPLPPGGQPSPFARDEGLGGWVIKNRQPAVVGDLEADPRWVRGVASGAPRSALAAPLIATEDVLGAMMFFSPEPEAFTQDQLHLVSAAAAQVASAINNAELYRLIRDQAERLGGMLRTQQVEASKNRAILEAIADGVMVSDAAGKIVLFNAAAERILDLASSEVLGKPADDYIGLYGVAGRSWGEAIKRWTDDPASYQTGDFLAERFELENEKVVEVHLAPVISGFDYLGSVSLFRDITREVEADRIKTEFVTTASHELRTPLTPIKGYVDAMLLGMTGPLGDEQARLLEIIKSNIDRLSVLVNDILDISKIEAGQAEVVREPLPLDGVIREVADGLRDRSAQAGKPLTVEVKVPAGLPLVLADRAMMTQVLTHLALNAFNYTPAGGTITFSASTQPDAVRVSVQDTGIGLAPEELPRVFERFYRAENEMVMATAGTGLGLSIVQKILEMHNGKLWAESAGPGQGSTFHIAVPVAN